MKYILSSYGINNPYIAASIPDHAVYPVGIEFDDFIDLDYSLLVVGSGFLFDAAAMEYLVEEQCRLPFLAPLIDSIQKLKQEGLLETFDGKAIIEQNLGEISDKTEQLCEDVAGWLIPVRAQWSVLKEDRIEFLERFGSTEKREINEHHFSVANAALRIDGSLNATLIREITRLIESRRRSFSAKETEYIKEVLRPLVCHTIVQDLVRFKTGGAILDWDDSQEYYKRLYAARWDQDSDRSLACHTKSLFTFSLPELQPKNVDSVIRFVRDDRNVRELRADVSAILARGEKFDERLGKRLVSEVLRAELAIQRKMRKFRLLGAALGAVVPGSGLMTEAAIEGVTFAGEDAAEAGFSRPHRWFYSLTEEAARSAESGSEETQRTDRWWKFWK